MLWEHTTVLIWCLQSLMRLRVSLPSQVYKGLRNGVQPVAVKLIPVGAYAIHGVG
jgi:hypothetical protein